MFKNCKGVSLIEVTFSLAIMTTVIAAITPLLTTIYEERLTIRQQLHAYEILENTLTDWIYSPRRKLATSNVVEKDGTSYTLSTTLLETNMMQICVSWQGKNGRFYNECGTASK